MHSPKHSAKDERQTTANGSQDKGIPWPRTLPHLTSTENGPKRTLWTSPNFYADIRHGLLNNAVYASEMDKTPLDYIDLGRCFRPHDDNQSAENAAAESYLLSSDPRHLTTWPKLLETPGVHVVLGEAGSGRTYEFKAKANTLRKEGREAFFLSLHKLATLGIEQVIESEDRQRLQACLEKDKDVYFFLDAVDESKLQRVSQFRDALDKFATLIQPGKGKATIFISSRVKDWLPATDRRHIQEVFDFPAENEVSSNDSDADGSDETELDDEAELDDAVAEAKEVESPVIQSVFVWTLAPLNKEQVKLYVERHRVVDAGGFVAALDVSFAWELAARPLDVNLLVAYWKEHRRIGHPAEMFEHLISEQLKERPGKAEYERLFPLEPGMAQQGAETLAAATIFCRRLDFQIEDETMSSTGGLDARACLPEDWRPAGVHALLSRPLFDAAIYGCTRFHHRGFAEYLATRWLVRLLRSECPVEDVLDLLFSSSRGKWQARESRLPVTVWLACIGDGEWVHAIRERLLESAPEAFLRHGDPSLLPVPFKERILDAVVARYADREMVRYETSDIALSRMAEPTLAAALVRHLGSPTLSSALKTELIKFAKVARLRAAVPITLDLLHHHVDDDYFVAHALWLVEALGTPEQFNALVAWVVELKKVDSAIYGQAVEILFPRFLTPSDLALLLSRLQDGDDQTWRLSYNLREALEPIHDPGLLESIANVLLPLIELAPVYDRTCISQRYAWLGPAIRVLLKNFLSASQLTEQQRDVASRSLWICTQEEVNHLSGFEHYGSNDADQTPDQLTQRHPLIRQAAFWLHYDQTVQRRKEHAPCSDANWVWDHNLKFVEIRDSDFEWICHDLITTTDENKRRASLCLAVRYWRGKRSNRSIKRLIKVAIQDSQTLKGEFANVSGYVWPGRLRHWWRRQTWNGFRNRFWWKKRASALTKVYWRIRNWLWLRYHLKSIRLGQMPGVLEDLISRNSGGSSSKYAPKSWEKMTDSHGTMVTSAIQNGCVAVWRSYDPRNSESITIGGIVGLAGLQYLWQAGGLRFQKWTPEEAEKATRYAILEMNGFSDWLPTLALHHPEAVIKVIEARIDFEWSNTTGDIRVIDRLQWSKSRLGSLLAPSVIARLELGDPPSPEALRSVLNLLIGHAETKLQAALATSRIRQYSPEEPQYFQWLLTWLQTDTRPAIEYFDQLVSGGSITAAQATNIAISACASFDDRFDRKIRLAQPDYFRPEVSPLFIRWIFRWIKPEEDIKRKGGSYTPTPRDDAQSFRSGLLSRLAGTNTPEAEAAFFSLIGSPEMQSERDYLLYLHERQSRRVADDASWNAKSIRTFEEHHQAEPSNTADLFAVGCRRLQVIKKQVEQPFDLNIGAYVRPGDDEAVFRQFLAIRLSEANKGLYKAPQEPVIRGELRLDLRLERPPIEGAVPIEVKLADDRSANSLLSDLKGQLVGDYLSSYSSRYGIFVIGLADRRPKGWEHPGTGKMLDFKELIAYLRERSVELLAHGTYALGVEVIGIDFNPPASARKS